MGIPFKAKGSGCTNATFEGRWAKYLPALGQKWQKQIIFKNFTLVSQS